MVRRLKLEVAYHGQSFHGWQKQRNQRTVQGELHEALAKLFRGHRVSVVGASRTDTGVHAAGQVAHLDPPASIPPEALVRGLNSRLPRQIRVLSARPVAATFHARKSALGKLYTYRARWREPRSSVARTTLGRGEGDFRFRELFCRPRPDGGTARLGIVHGPQPRESSQPHEPCFECESVIVREGIDIDFFGEGFLRYQVRRMVGALLEVGSGDREVDGLRNLIENPRPGAPIRTAPAQGLCLEHIYYRSCPAVAGAQSSKKS